MLGKVTRRFFGDLVQYVPKCEPPCKEDMRDFADFLKHYRKIVALTGAGVSTESGIPDYRSEEVGIFNRTNYKPVSSNDFLKDEKMRIRFWTRNYFAWPEFSTKSPSLIHQHLAYYSQMEDKIQALITQNVDGLHHKAGTRNIIELHGNSYWVRCLKCKYCVSRYDFQKFLYELNSDLKLLGSSSLRPDGDLEIDEAIYEKFKIPDCQNCGGIMKPTVVFFGDNIPQWRVKMVEKEIEKCDSLLVMGTSLTTLSSYRIVEQAYKLNKFITIVNIGKTRGDKFADMVINAKCSEIFPDLKIV